MCYKVRRTRKPCKPNERPHKAQTTKSKCTSEGGWEGERRSVEMMARDDDELCFVREFMDAMTFIIQFIIGAALQSRVFSAHVDRGRRKMVSSQSLRVSFARFRMLRMPYALNSSTIMFSTSKMGWRAWLQTPYLSNNRNNGDAIVWSSVPSTLMVI